jgi:uncharacterized FAD-dependent dehydrogenase
MIRDIDLRLSPADAFSDASIRSHLTESQGINPDELKGLRVQRRSIDARQRTIYINLRVRVWLNETPDTLLFPEITYPDVSQAKRTAIVVGAGPGGLFAALRLMELHIRPIVLERGKPIHERKRDIAHISRTHTVDPESNYSFGEGGAGAFSDGKLYTRSKKRGNVEKILQVLCQFGADPSILVDAHPHIGTDKLPGIIEAIRERIRSGGGEVHFETKMTDLLIRNHRVEGVTTSDGRTFLGPVILATGHSARDVYRLLHKNGITQEAKALAVGVRLEHPAPLIDQIMYHHPEGRGRYLPAAEYSLVTQVRDRGVYSFCMCPGGFVVPAASGPEQVVVNGMSPSNRNSKWSNAGLVVEVRPEDILRSGKRDTFTCDPESLLALKHTAQHCPELLMLEFQEHLERHTWMQGGRRQTAPAQRMNDFVQHTASTTLAPSSYTPGITSSPLHEWLPNGIGSRLQEGFRLFDRSAKGFLSNEATLLGMETRTSSPIRIPRDPKTLMHNTLSQLYPCGEGAGYAGGIVSAAIDGERCAESLSLADE